MLHPLRVGFGVIFLGHLVFFVVSVAVHAEHGMTSRAISALFPVLLLQAPSGADGRLSSCHGIDPDDLAGAVAGSTFP